MEFHEATIFGCFKEKTNEGEKKEGGHKGAKLFGKSGQRGCWVTLAKLCPKPAQERNRVVGSSNSHNRK
jgi:hypothetical protein